MKHKQLKVAKELLSKKWSLNHLIQFVDKKWRSHVFLNVMR